MYNAMETNSRMRGPISRTPWHYHFPGNHPPTTPGGGKPGGPPTTKDPDPFPNPKGNKAGKPCKCPDGTASVTGPNGFCQCEGHKKHPTHHTPTPTTPGTPPWETILEDLLSLLGPGMGSSAGSGGGSLGGGTDAGFPAAYDTSGQPTDTTQGGSPVALILIAAGAGLGIWWYVRHKKEEGKGAPEKSESKEE